MQGVRHYHEVLRTYCSVSKEVAQFSGHWRPFVIFNMLASRFAYCKGPAYYWLFNFELKKHTEWDQYLTKVQMERMQLSTNPASALRLVDDKLRFYERCLNHGIATPRVLCAIEVTKDLYAPANVPVLRNPEELLKKLLEQGDGKLVLKSVTGSYGEHFLTLAINRGKIFDHRGNALTATSIMQHCRKAGANFLIQEHMRLHDAFKTILPGDALGTIRVVTLLRPGEDSIMPYSYAKIPVPGNLTDNFHHGESGNLIVGIDVADGTMMSAWGTTNTQGRGMAEIEVHPNTRRRFRGTPVPFWDRIVGVARQAAKAFDELVTVGWDIAVTDKGVTVIEGNCRYDIDVHQITLNRGLRSEIEAFYESARASSQVRP